MEYYDPNNLLKAYQVGDNDIVAAFDEEGAIEVLVLYTGCSKTSDYNKDEDVTGLTGKEIGTLRDWLNELNEPEYMYGWD
jgi:hypothetical protein